MEGIKERRLFDLVYEKYAEVKEAIRIIDSKAKENTERRESVIKTLNSGNIEESEELIYEICVDTQLHRAEVTSMYNTFRNYYDAFQTMESGLIFDTELLEFISKNDDLYVSRKFDIENGRFKEITPGSVEEVRLHYKESIINTEYAKHLAKQIER